jgi:hypothetical protein
MAENIVMENVKVVTRNFSGRRPSRYIDVSLDESTAVDLINKGWDVWSNYDETESALRVYIDFDIYPSTVIFLVTEKSKTRLDLDILPILSEVEFDEVDVCIKPYKFKEGSEKGTKACVSSMYVTIKE